MKNNEKAVRAAIRRHVQQVGAERYRITSDGEVHVYGTMPNANQAGWYLFAQSPEDARDRIAEG